MMEIIHRYFVVGDGPLLDKFYTCQDHDQVLDVIEKDFRHRSCLETINSVYQPFISRLGNYVILYVPEYKDTETPFQPPPYLHEIRRWQFVRLVDDGVLNLEAA